MDALQSNAVIGFSLLPVWVLVGLFQYLKRFTKKPHFQTWTSGWLFYALYLTVSAMPEGTMHEGILTMAKNFCLATGAVLMLWGSFQFINVPAQQRLIGMMIVFNLMWSWATVDKPWAEGWGYFPAFAFLALASGFTAFCFFSRRTRHTQRGAALLTMAFSLWALFLLCTPFLQSRPGVLDIGFMTSSVLQLFIATATVVLVLEEVRGRLESTAERFSREVELSSRYQTEAEQATQNYRMLFDNSRDAVAIVGADDLEIFELNNAARKLFGLKERRSGMPITTYCAIPNQKDLSAKKFLAALAKNAEVELTLHDGSRVNAKVRTQCIRYGGSKATQIIFCDVAERASLGRQIRSASGKMSALGQIISGVAHELNNPLAAIKGYTDLLLLTSQLDPQTRGALLKVSVESNRAAKLVRDLVAFARPETPRVEPLNINDLINSFAEQRRSELESREITLDVQLDHDTALTLASSDQIQQVLAHLLNNAVEAVEAVDGDRTITLSSQTIDSKVQIRIEDSGPGVDTDVLPRIFEPFFTTKPVGTGTGLGLSVCYSIILQHKGKISYQPSPLGGACFIVDLPAAFSTVAPTAKIATPEFRPRNRMSRSARLLVVDDEPSVAALLNDMLTLLGHQVVMETSPHEALNRLEEQEFDAVLSDYRMPGMTGGQLYERAVGINPRYAQQFIFFTGNIVDPETNDFFQNRNVRCLLKPFQLSALQSTLAEVLDQGSEGRIASVG